MVLQIPQHIAVIMDGNGRWAKKKFLPKKLGYQRGADTAEKLVRLAKQYGVKFLTLYAFSSENWKRPESEVSDLMDLFRNYLKNHVRKLSEEGVKISFIGDREHMPSDIIGLMNEVEQISIHNNFTLVLAVSYGARDEIRKAAILMAQDIVKNGHNIHDIKLNDFDRFISIPGIPDPDLLIRTSGEYRVSNFLLWQLAYTELYFTDTLWPDFTEEDFIKALQSFSTRERRYGK
jgi:undecaprenyl diphosphate synthase